MPKISTLAQSYPADCVTLQQLRAEFADGVYFIANGYITYSIREVKAYEHRLVAELAFGEIPPAHHVHHINRIRSDNRVVNLQIVQDRAHHQMHLPATGKSLVCPVCKRTFWATQTRIRRAKRKQNYCSERCAQVARRKVERPPKDTLITLLTATPNFLSIGHQYGVSDNAVRKWCVQYGLPTKTADWEARCLGAMVAGQVVET